MKHLRHFALLISGIVVAFLPASVTAESTTLENPLGSGVDSAEQLIVRMLTGFLGVLALFSLVMVIYGGFQYIWSAGSPERIKSAKDTIVWALLGLVIAFMSLAAVNFVVRAFQGAL
ncbi:MAG: hypothetical protein Q8Q20_02045 [bacterium]|nr:hypothetical protein [bacterium]